MKKLTTITALAALSTPAFAAITFSALDVNQGASEVDLVTAAQITTEFGQALDNTYTGSVTFTWEMTYDAIDGGNAANTFAFLQFNGAGGTDLTGIGNYWAGNQYSTWNEAGVGGDGTRQESGLVIATADTQTFTLTIDFVAGADDTATLNGAGFTNLALNTGDYSFETLSARGGNNTTQFDITNGSIAAVPEPSSTALIGLGGLALILRRRK